MASKQEDEWTTVRASDKKRVMRKRGKPRKHGVAAVVDASAQLQDMDLLQSCLEHCLKYLVRQTTFWKQLVLNLPSKEDSGSNDVDSNYIIQKMICYGIGNFSKTGTSSYAAPLWQLACAVALQRHLQPQRVFYLDPSSAATENAFVADRLGMQILKTNDRGNHPVDNKHNCSTLFFMPHCPAQLYENVVWSNYGNINNNIWILGNPLGRIAETNHCPCLKALESYWDGAERLMKLPTKECSEAPGNLLGAFNDTYLTRLPLSRDRDHKLPPRPYDHLLPVEEDGELL